MKFSKIPIFVISSNRICCFHPLAFYAMARRNCTVKHNSPPLQQYAHVLLKNCTFGSQRDYQTEPECCKTYFLRECRACFTFVEQISFPWQLGREKWFQSWSDLSHNCSGKLEESVKVLKWRLSKHSLLQQSVTSFKKTSMMSMAKPHTARRTSSKCPGEMILDHVHSIQNSVTASRKYPYVSFCF